MKPLPLAWPTSVGTRGGRPRRLLVTFADATVSPGRDGVYGVSTANLGLTSILMSVMFVAPMLLAGDEFDRRLAGRLDFGTNVVGAGMSLTSSSLHDLQMHPPPTGHDVYQL
eukprot:CAMPEP_0182603686 /NCGR_PEP_ID=MMETSP1324-20130603/92621_1 /TAXON_ID=236786 /ORGANISM="Florenciella sp., Strain RCC1587" /LENGTH=111 /DNA_ID=CAMNT_0024821617 /DNA_START=290 /DNA_END=625 /DNA_ORIENTATION=+